MQPVEDLHPYEDPKYWSNRATAEGVATLGWSERLNQFYYDIKQNRLADYLAKVPQSGSVLEVGCGVGRIGSYIATQRPDIKLVGVDFSHKMLDFAASTGAYQDLVVADITHLPFSENSFDLVLAMDVLFHVVRPSKKGLAWLELARVARQEANIFAYGTAHEITSLVVIRNLVHRFLPRYVRRYVSDRITIILTKLND